jgi:hypothetical protein
MANRKKKKGKKGKKGKMIPSPEPVANTSNAVAAASEYLENWSLHRQTGTTPWKFSKRIQTFLLKSWPHRHRVPGPAFKQLLAYLTSLPTNAAQRTIEQARELASSAEAASKALEEKAVAQQAEGTERDEGEDSGDDEDDEVVDDATANLTAQELEERKAVLKIQQARALRVLSVLVSPTEAPAETG